MYRHSAHVNCIVQNSLPSPENTSDSESDIIEALDRKRRQLDEEINKFKAVKDREFRDFEKDLKVQKKRSRGSSTSSESSPSKPSGSASTASVLNLLASAQNGLAIGWAGYKPRRGGDGVGDKITKAAPLSKPTLSLDKLNITGETTPPVNALGAAPRSPNPNRSTFQSSSGSSVTLTPPKPNLGNSGPPTPRTEQFDSLAGVFIPAYLPLLESRDPSPLVRSPQPLNPQDEEKKKLQLNAESKREAEKQEQPSSHSLPQQQVSPTVVATKRTHSTPTMPSTSLPSALRTSSGSNVRKRKHVTFQLADSAIVEPSSSYEEIPSPDARSESETSLGGVDDVRPSGRPNEQGASAEKHSKKGGLSPRDNNSQRRGRLLSPAVSPLPSPSPSPTIEDSSLLASPDESGFSNGLLASEDGGSGVGFFELDEELASPAFTEDRSFDLKIEGDESGLQDLDEKREEILQGGSEEMEVGSFAAGSVPIDIVRPISGSWVGSFGH